MDRHGAVSHLITGDQLVVQDGVAVKAHWLRPVYVLEVYFRLSTARTDVERIVAGWQTQCEATMDSDISCVLVSENIGFLKDATDIPDVEFTDLIREPGDELDLYAIPDDLEDR